MTTQTIAGIAIPDTPLVRETTEYIRDVEDDLLFDHSRRVFLFGALQGRRRGLDPDLELLYIGAMCHDLGLTQHGPRLRAPFEVDGANAARELPARPWRTTKTTVRNVWLSHRAAHHPGRSRVPRPEIALVTAGVETDVLGIGRDDLDRRPHRRHCRTSSARLQAPHPARLHRRQPHRPRTTFGNVNADVLEHFDPTFVRDDFVEIILNTAGPSDG